MAAERRRFKRYLTSEEQLYVFSDESPIKGDVRNISIDGLAFEYNPDLYNEVEATRTVILASSRLPFYLAGVPGNIIYDIKTIEEEQSFSGRKTRRCGLQYGDLSKSQRKTLDSLLKKMSKT
jgi:hypothetical protein